MTVHTHTHITHTLTVIIHQVKYNQTSKTKQKQGGWLLACVHTCRTEVNPKSRVAQAGLELATWLKMTLSL